MMLFIMEALQRSEEKSRAEHDQLKLLLEFTNMVASNLTLRELMHSLSASVRNVMKCDSVWINLADEDEKNMRVVVQDFPEGKGYFDKTLVQIKGSVNEKPFFERKPLIMNRPEDITMYPEEYWRVVAEDIHAACLLPLISRNRVLGVLSLARLSETRFQEDEVEFLKQVANQLAIAVENALAYEEIAALKDQLAQEKLYLEDEIRNEIGFEEILGQSPALLHALKQIETVAPTDANVLILGETGTGKHRANCDRIRRTTLDWRILCPGPMVHQQPLGLNRMRISLDRLPVQIPSFTRFLPGAFVLPFFVSRIPEMIVSYADAATLMLASLAPDAEMSRHRVGLALPVGMRGKKKNWTAKPNGS